MTTKSANKKKRGFYETANITELLENTLLFHVSRHELLLVGALAGEIAANDGLSAEEKIIRALWYADTLEQTLANREARRRRDAGG